MIATRLAMNLRRWQAQSFAAALLALGPMTGPAAEPAALRMEQIADSVYVHEGQHAEWNADNGGDIANLSFVIGSRCIAVIDTGSTRGIGARLLRSIRIVSDLPVCYVINTHAHPDHLLGNAAFTGAATEFVAHHNMARAQATRGQAYLRAVHRDLGELAAGTELVAPDIAVAEQLKLDLGDRQLQLVAHPTAHTDVDLTVFDPVSKTLWLGDLAFVGHLPVVDGNLNGWISLMQATIGKLQVEHAIPGHGRWTRPGWPDFLAPQMQYLTELRDTVRTAIADGQSLSETLETNQVGKNDHWEVYPAFHQRNVSAVFAELEWE